MDATLPQMPASASDDVRELATQAIEAVMSDFAVTPTEDGLCEAVERHLTDSDDANAIVYEHAQHLLVMFRAKDASRRAS